MGILRGVLVEAYIKDGPDKARSLAGALGCDPAEATQAYEAFLSATTAHFQGQDATLPESAARRLVDAQVPDLAARLGIEPDVAGRLQQAAISFFKERIEPADRWILDLLLNVRPEDSQAASRSALRQSLLDGDMTKFRRLPAEQRITMAEEAIAAGLNARSALESYLTEQEQQILRSPHIAAEDRERVEEDLALCRQVILDGPDSVHGTPVDPVMIEGLRTGNAAAFREAPRQAVVRLHYNEHRSPSEKVRHELLSVRGVLLVLILVPTLWMLWTYGVGSGQTAAKPPASISKLPAADLASLKMKTVTLDGETAPVSAGPVSETLYHSIVPRAGWSGCRVLFR